MSVIEDSNTQESEGERSGGGHHRGHKHHRRTHRERTSKRGEHKSHRGERGGTSDTDQSSSRRRHRRSRKPSKMGSFWANLLASLLIFVHIAIDTVLEFGLGWYLGDKKRSPAISSDDQKLCTKSAVELAKLIRERKLKAHDVVKAYIDRMKEVNVSLNAVVDGPFMEALDEAKEIDEKIASGQLTEVDFTKKPFLGVPFTTKDSTSVKGKLHTLGLISRKNEKSLVDAECVRLMKEAGAIIIATSNVPEVNKWSESRNSLIGQTNNPYDTRRSAGGSSGGEAALIAACATGFGLGTDIGGSIRIPAFNCGIFGHKPTVGAINTKGCTFRTGKEKETMVVAGPMCRHATDLMPIFKVLVDPEMSTDLKLNEEVDVTKLRYFYIPSNDMPACNPVNREAQSLMFKLTRYFSDLTGEEVKQASLPGTEISGKLWRYWMTREPADFNKLLGNGANLNPFVELFKKIMGKSEFTMAAIYSLIDGLLPAEKAPLMEEATTKCSEALAEMLGDDGVLFFHSSPRTAPFHYYPLVKMMDFAYFSIFNVLRVPATQVPMGLDSKGMPLGIQVVAAKNCDRLCLAVAEELEKEFGGWVAPFENRN
ncbi:fatty-acid amide hydrolase 2 [Episyrphus balteatus]|uniref:fatty-acid amide hydrolase 2 n=1 Tax=Episyrphus balteatus TaxID=286459 RepID=UPI002484F449|nr:fatty-acid amide hydrolase 2 [Episyrphus balteatus]